MCPGPCSAWAYGAVGRGADINGQRVEISGRGEVVRPDATPIGLENGTHQGVWGHGP